MMRRGTKIMIGAAAVAVIGLGGFLLVGSPAPVTADAPEAHGPKRGLARTKSSVDTYPERPLAVKETPHRERTLAAEARLEETSAQNRRELIARRLVQLEKRVQRAEETGDTERARRLRQRMSYLERQRE